MAPFERWNDDSAEATEQRRAPRRARRFAGAAVIAMSASALGAGVAIPAASARPASARIAPAASAVVVKVAKTRGKFHNVLTTTATVGKTLYTAKSCSASCLSAWPPLYMPKGKSTPLGVSGLGTVKRGTKLQVTFHGHPLYTFVSDSGASVNGNGVGGFSVVTTATK